MAVRAYLVAVAAAQALLAFVSVAAGVVADAMLVLVMTNHALAGGRLAEEAGTSDIAWAPRAEAVAVLSLVPLLGLMAGTLPLDRHTTAWIAVLAGSMLVSAVLVARPAPLRSVRSVLGGGLAQAAVTLAGVPLGLAAYLVVEPSAVATPGDGVLAVAAAGGVLTVAGAAWELVLRGMLQPTLATALGGTGVVAAALASAAAGAAVGGGRFAAAMLAGGAVLGTAAARTGSIAGAVAAQGILLVGLLVVWPAVLG